MYSFERAGRKKCVYVFDNADDSGRPLNNNGNF